MSIDAITTALQKIYLVIPKEILTAAFNPDLRRMNIDQCIIEDVINAHIINDINLRSGKIIDILLTPEDAVVLDSPIPTYHPSGYHAVYRIPPFKRENRPIVAIISIRSPYSNMAGNCSNGTCGVTMSQLANATLESHTFANTTTAPTPELLNGDTIRLLGTPTVSMTGWIVTGRLAYTSDFTNMDISSIAVFSKLVLAAVKTYIYTNLVIKMGSAVLHTGRELSVFKERVDEYASAYEEYDSLLLEFTGAATLDTQRLMRITNWMI